MIPLAINFIYHTTNILFKDIYIPYHESHNHGWLAVWIILPYASVLIGLTCGIKLRRHLRSKKGRAVMSDRNRRNSLAAWARLKGLKSNPTASVTIAGRYWQLKCLQRGEGHFAFNVMEGIFGKHKVCAFDYYYETATIDKGGNRVVTGRYYLSAVVVETEFKLKPMIIHTENIINKIAEYTGLHDINFESMEFNDKFHVKASDRRWAYDVVNQATMELLLNHCRFNIELNGNYVIAYRDTLFSPGYFDEALDLIIGIADNLPKPICTNNKVEGK